MKFRNFKQTLGRKLRFSSNKNVTNGWWSNNEETATKTTETEHKPGGEMKVMTKSIELWKILFPTLFLSGYSILFKPLPNQNQFFLVANKWADGYRAVPYHNNEICTNVNLYFWINNKWHWRWKIFSTFSSHE